MKGNTPSRFEFKPLAAAPVAQTARPARVATRSPADAALFAGSVLLAPPRPGSGGDVALLTRRPVPLGTDFLLELPTPDGRRAMFGYEARSCRKVSDGVATGTPAYCVMASCVGVIGDPTDADLDTRALATLHADRGFAR